MADAADDDLAPVVRPREQQGGLPTILTHLLTLQARARRELYSHPSNALSIFRLLPPLARHLILVLLFLPNGPNGLPQLPSDDVAALLTRGADAAAVKDEGAGTSSKKSKSQRALDEAKELLSDLGIIVEAKQVVSLNGIWTDSLKRALTGGGDHRSFGVPSQPGESQRIPISRLDQYALRSWESILLYMVASIDARTPSKEVLLLLRQAGLMQPEAPRSENLYTMGITSDGFQFLLNDVPTQLWTLLETYLRFLSSERNSTSDVVEHLTFLFTLSSATLGQDYEISALAPSQRGMLEFFRDMGLVYMKNERSRSFYPTRLITTLTSFGATPLIGGGGGSGGGKDGIQDEAGAGGGTEEERGFVILETNYKVYAYTSNKLRIDVLNLFVHIKSRFPNLVTGVITRDSVKEALSNGIGAEQIIMYLTHHAHPQMFKNDPLLPVTVTDQIRLWEREKRRIRAEEGFLHEEFGSGADFELVRTYADNMRVLLWSDSAKRRMFISKQGNDTVKEFIRRRLIDRAGQSMPLH